MTQGQLPMVVCKQEESKPSRGTFHLGPSHRDWLHALSTLYINVRCSMETLQDLVECSRGEMWRAVQRSLFQCPNTSCGGSY